MNRLRPIMLVLHRVGPYHHARFQAASSVLAQHLVVLETRPDSQEYPWQTADQKPTYTLKQLCGSVDPEKDPPNQVLKKQLKTFLEKFEPQVIVIVGWSDPAYLQLLLMAHRSYIPLVLISDSRKKDMKRHFLKEWVKQQLLRGFSSALVAGSQSQNYLLDLGFDKERIFYPWDVVDNNRFAEISSLIIHDDTKEKPFICVGRFIAEKNHQLLLEAYKLYQDEGGVRPLLLIGSGALQQTIQQQCEKLPNPNLVKVLPFQQLEKLALFYGQAHAVILPSQKDTWGLVINEAIACKIPVIVSNACGCADDLIEDGTSGWVFRSADSGSLLTCMKKSDIQTPAERVKMISASQKLLSKFGLQNFADALVDACQTSMTSYRRSKRSYLAAFAILGGR